LLLRGLRGEWDEDTSSGTSFDQHHNVPKISGVTELRLPEKGSVRVEDIDEISK
jgi:hypothetical protein